MKPRLLEQAREPLCCGRDCVIDEALVDELADALVAAETRAYRAAETLRKIVDDFELTEANREANGEARNYVAERLAGYAYAALEAKPR